MKAEIEGNRVISVWENSSLRGYLGEVKRRHGIVETLALPNMRDLPPVRIEKLFVQPLLSTQKINASTEEAEWPSGETLLQALTRNTRIVLLGDPGSGKTTLISWLAWRLASGLVSPLPEALSNILPLPCILRDLDATVFDKSRSVLELAMVIARGLLGDRISEEFVECLTRLVNEGQFILILDGLDEIPLERRRIVSEWVQQAATRDALAVVTGRVVGYDDYPIDRKVPHEPKYSKERDKSAEALSRKEGADRSWAAIRYLMPFDRQRIANYIDNWYLQRSANNTDATKRSADLMAALDKSKPMQELARTPNLLSLIAIVHRERANLPDGKALLYKEIANAYINTIDQHRRIDLGDSLARFSWEIKENWIGYVAFKMQLQRLENDKISEAGFLVSEEQVIAWISEAMSVSRVPQPETAAPEFIEWVARRCGLLIPRGEQQYAFVHLSFQEYFCARFLAGRVMSRPFIKDSLPENAPVTRDLLQEWVQITEWVECFVFLFELISAENDIDWVQDLAEILFTDLLSEVSFANAPVHLAVRLLVNNHVYLSGEWRDKLGKWCAEDAFAEWLYPVPSDKGLLKIFEQTEFAVIERDEDPSDISKSLPVEVTPSIIKVIQPEKLLIYIGIGRRIKTVDLLAGAPNLQYVALAHTSVSDVSCLSGCKELRAVEIVDTPVCSVEPIGGSKKIRHVGLQDTLVEDIAFVGGMSELDILDLEGSPVPNLSQLSKSNSLGYLSIARTRISDLTPIQSLTKLSYLDLNGLKLDDLKILRKLPGIYSLNIGNTVINDISEVANVKELRMLFARNVADHYLREIAKCSSVVRLSIGGPALVSFSSLSKMTKLSLLDIKGVSNLDVSIFKKMKGLREIILTDVKFVGDVTVFEQLKNLKRLVIDGKEIFDIR